MKKYKFTKQFSFEGKRYTVYADTQEECITKIANKKRDLEEGRIVIGGAMTLSSWVGMCLRTYKSGVKEESLKDMTYRINRHLISPLGSIPIKSIHPIQLQEILNGQSGMSYSHVKKLMQEIKFIFEKAKENRIILENPAKGLVMPPCVKGERRSITEHERKHLLLVAKNNPKHRLWLLMLFCGCRPAEAIKSIGKDIM